MNLCFLLNSYFRYAKWLKEYNVCAIYPHKPKSYLPHHHLAKYPTKEWQLYAASAPTNYTWGVYVHKVDNKDDPDQVVSFYSFLHVVLSSD